MRAENGQTVPGRNGTSAAWPTKPKASLSTNRPPTSSRPGTATRYERNETRILVTAAAIIAGIAQEQIAAHPGASWIRLARATAAEFAAAGVGAAIGSLIAVPGVALIMSLYYFITNRFTIPAIQAHEARGREEGREWANRAWSEWNQRRLAHEAQGIPFNEPPPDRQPPRNGEQL